MTWERVIEGRLNQPTVHRVAVPGGWIYAAFNGMVFVPEPTKLDGEAVIQQANRLYDAGYEAAVKDHEFAPTDQRDWERGHKAGYMQALANHEGDANPLETVLDRLVTIADKLIPGGGSNSELAEAENAICAAYKALGKGPDGSRGDKVTPQRTYESDKAKQDELGKAYAQGFKDGRGDKGTAALLTKAADALTAEGYQHDDPLVAELYVTASELEGK